MQGKDSVGELQHYVTGRDVNCHEGGFEGEQQVANSESVSKVKKRNSTLDEDNLDDSVKLTPLLRADSGQSIPDQILSNQVTGEYSKVTNDYNKESNSIQESIITTSIPLGSQNPFQIGDKSVNFSEIKLSKAFSAPQVSSNFRELTNSVDSKGSKSTNCENQYHSNCELGSLYDTKKFFEERPVREEDLEALDHHNINYLSEREQHIYTATEN